MASYIVLEPAQGPNKAERALLVRDGFAFLAFLLPAFWFLWHRMWLEALIVLVAGVLLAGVGTLLGYATFAPLLSLLLSLFVGMEGQNLRVNTLRRRGWSVWGVVEGRSRGEAELRYAAEVDPEEQPRSAAAPPATKPKSPVRKVTRGHSAFGLLDYPRGT